MLRSARRQGRILVIDDERFIAELIRDVLRGKGLEVEVGSEARDAITRAESGRFDLVISDYAMPGLNGLEFTRRVRAKSPHTKVLIVSAYLDGEAVDALEAEPCFSGYLRKPFDIFQLVVITERLLAERLAADRPVAELPTAERIAPAITERTSAPPASPARTTGRRSLPFQGEIGGAAPR